MKGLKCVTLTGADSSTSIPELPKIYKAAGAAPFWIDMEGCLRTTDNRFEITAAKHVAVIVNRYLLGSMRFGWDS
jgi:hypothetical protein